MTLEAIADSSVEDRYDFDILESPDSAVQLRLDKMLRQLLSDVDAALPAGVIAAKFHNCLAAALCDMAQKARNKTCLNTVALSGGVFCNRYLTNRLIEFLNRNGFRVLFNIEVPSNDGGIALGQAAIAARRVSRKTRP
jgi:hydrogenase maturation protein HypF